MMVHSSIVLYGDGRTFDDGPLRHWPLMLSMLIYGGTFADGLPMHW